MKVYVSWDPLCEEVICVHSKPDQWCNKCHTILIERCSGDGCYLPEEDEFEIEDDVFEVKESIRQIMERVH